MIDLSTTYLGMRLSSPLVVSASPLSRSVELVQRMEDAGAGAVVLFSLFEEQLAEPGAAAAEAHVAGSPDPFANLGRPIVGADEYLAHIERLKAAVRLPVIGSLNGVSPGGWTRYARLIQEAGADALELNVYYLPSDPRMSGGEVEEAYLELVHSVRASITIPLAVKLCPFWSSTPHICRRIAEAGADGLVLFNRFYQPDLDLDAYKVIPDLKLSTSDDLRLPLRWIAIMDGRVPCDFALTSGVHTGADALKAVLAGAAVAMLASELLARGVGRLGAILGEMRALMQAREYRSIDQIRGGMSQRRIADPAVYERANYLRGLTSLA